MAEKECLTVVWVIQTHRLYILGTEFTVYSDQASLRRILEISEHIGRLMRSQRRLGQLDLDVQYKKGLLNILAEAFFCLRSLAGTTVPDDADIFACPFNSTVKPANRNGMTDLDSFLALNIDFSPSFVPIHSDEIRMSQDTEDFYRLIRARFGKRKRVPFALNGDSILFCSVGRFEQMVIPQSIVPRVLYLGPHTKMAGHPGGRRV